MSALSNTLHGRWPRSSTRHRLPLAALTAVLLLSGCGDGDGAAADRVDVTVTEQVFSAEADDCVGAFVPHPLDHETLGRGEITAMSDGTGAGVLLEDLDDDGRVDIVLPNLAGETSILWNEGELEFERTSPIGGRFRQALSADLDHDGHRDLLLTTGLGPPVALLADPDTLRAYQRQEFRTRVVAYSAAVGDLAGDGSIRVATGSYNAELTQNRDLRAITGVDVGAAVHTIGDGGLDDPVKTQFLTEQSQALVTLTVDLDGDGHQDVVMGNDLGTPDWVWLGGPDGLTEATPFDTTTLSTMSLDVVDFDNDGDPDVIATDMAPMADEPAEPWAEVMPDVDAAMVDEIQDPRNKVQLQNDEQRFDDRAGALGVDATGWSWSGVAGDLDNDGRLDLYVVNGMQATSVFPDLPDGALVEANQAFRNVGDRLEPAPEWGLADTAGGRGMAQADLDDDGDLDIVINNLGSPAMVFENQLCQGTSIVVDPRWPDVANLDALGTRIVVAAGDETHTRQITSTRGYLSSPPTAAHIGLGGHDGAVDIEIVWPDGASSRLENVDPGRRLTVERQP